MALAFVVLPPNYGSHRFFSRHTNDSFPADGFRRRSSTTASQTQKLRLIQVGYSPNNMNQHIKTLCSEQRLEEAVSILQTMEQQDIPVESSSYARLLQTCADLQALEQGKQIHTYIVLNGLTENVYLGSKLLNMYVMCGSLVEARLLFDQIPKRTRFFWNMMTRAYSMSGLYNEALLLYDKMLLANVQPNRFTYPFVLKACAYTKSIDLGREIHEYAVDVGLDSDVFVGSALVDMYVKCGFLEDARDVFDKMPEPNVAAWNAIITGYAQSGYGEEALSLLREMQMMPEKPDLDTIVSALSACATLQQGKEIHGFIIKSGYDSQDTVVTSLASMYCKCGSVGDTPLKLDERPPRNVTA
ncbi:pentatricopeptide repeat-containing protein At4g37170 [Cryptomeria japonica]|uniref:pentatricopeptide repeat-containing protein At4g37170 n=1 Tax=Cryptomeria japonica TaxID=3369 RepID=UPI0027DA8A0D|nr:pentatricopeptide repeat-containing protein At4g37170 [Cryptomeria japonica]